MSTLDEVTGRINIVQQFILRGRIGNGLILIISAFSWYDSSTLFPAVVAKLDLSFFVVITL